MFIPVTPNPLRIDFPAILQDATYDVELAPAVDLSNFKYGAPWVRVHDNAGTQLANFRMKIVGFPVWPDDSSGPRFSPATPSYFQNTSVTVLETDEMGANTLTGDLVTQVASGAVVAAPLMMPAARVLAHFFPTAGNLAAGYVVLSVGLVVTP